MPDPATLILASLADGDKHIGMVYERPPRYVSTAAIRLAAPPGARGAFILDPLDRIAEQVLSPASLSELVQRPSLKLYPGERHDDLEIVPVTSVWVPGRPTPSFRISYTHTDPRAAQAVVRETVTQFFTEGADVEVVDPPNEPRSPIYPNRLVITGIGLASGLLLGVVSLRLRSPGATPPRQDRVSADRTLLHPPSAPAS